MDEDVGISNDEFWANIALWDKATPKQRARAAKRLLGRDFKPADCGHSHESMGCQALADLVCNYSFEQVREALK